MKKAIIAVLALSSIYLSGCAVTGTPTTNSALAQVQSICSNSLPTLAAFVAAESTFTPATQAVIADTSVLRTLPERELAAGLAEVIKTAAIADHGFFSWIESNIEALTHYDETALAIAVRRSCEVKAKVVGEDERESGLRAILNFGHTFGHAIEAGLGYGEWLHGEAVGCGMVMAADLSARLGLLSENARARLVKVTREAHLPIRAPALGADRYIDLMHVDKKAEGGEIKFVLLKQIGEAVISAAPEADLRATLAASI